MPLLPTILAGGMLAALVLYALTGGADFGGGFWNLLSRGPRGPGQRRLVAHAIGPVWETNHIWIIIAVVYLFAGFPSAYALVSTWLFVPVHLMLTGIILRGAAFAMHSYRLHEEEGAPMDGWGVLFAASSLLTPILLGVIVGSISMGTPAVPARHVLEDAGRWISLFPFSVGLLTLALFALLAAAYLVLETDDPELSEDFRLRALFAWGATVVLAPAALFLAAREAPAFHRSLVGSAWSPALLAAAAFAAAGTFLSLRARRARPARACAAALAVLILAGWGLAQFPFIVRPDLSIASAAAPRETIRLVLEATAAGAVFLFPAIFILFRVFKREALFARPGGRRG